MFVLAFRSTLTGWVPTAGGLRRESLTVQQHIPEGAALQGQARQPRGVVLPHTQPQVLGALQPARVPFLQLEKVNTTSGNDLEPRL